MNLIKIENWLLHMHTPVFSSKTNTRIVLNLIGTAVDPLPVKQITFLQCIHSCKSYVTVPHLQLICPLRKIKQTEKNKTTPLPPPPPRDPYPPPPKKKTTKNKNNNNPQLEMVIQDEVRHNPLAFRCQRVRGGKPQYNNDHDS